MAHTPHEKISPKQWDRWPVEVIINTLILTPLLYVPMALHMAWGADDTAAAIKIAGYPLGVGILWTLAVLPILGSAIQ